MTGDKTPDGKTSKPNQPLAASLPIFDELDGIDEARKVQVREKTTLDKLLEVVFDIAEKRRNAYSLSYFTHFDMNDLNYIDIYKRMKEEELVDVTFTDEDLRNFILSMANHDLDINTAQCLGMLTGCLLQLLTERNAQEGKTTTFYINGNGNRFDYLFLCAKDVHNVIVEDFCGDYLGYGIGSYLGHANLVCGLNLKGNILFGAVGGKHGSVRQLIGVTLEGHDALSCCGQSYGNIRQVIGIGITGDNAFYGVSANNGVLEQIVGIDVFGEKIFEDVGANNGKVSTAIYENLNPDPFSKVVYDSFIPDERYKLIKEKVILLTRQLPNSNHQQILKIAESLYSLMQEGGDFLT